MAIYDVNGTQLYACYDANGGSLANAYDADGNLIFSASGISLKVAEYNVGQWYIGSGVVVPTDKDAEYYALQNGMIQDIDADILCLCEYRTQFSANRTARSLLSQYYPYIQENNGLASGYNGKCICSKYPISNYSTHYYVSDAGRQNNYDVVTVTVENTPITVICTHLEPSDMTVKAEQAQELFTYCQTLTGLYLIGGDFNSTLYDPFSEGNIAIYQQFLNDGCTIANDGAFGIFPTACNSANWSEAFAIDNIIVSDGITITSASTDLTKVNDSIADKIDHVPFIATVHIEDNQ